MKLQLIYLNIVWPQVSAKQLSNTELATQKPVSQAEILTALHQSSI